MRGRDRGRGSPRLASPRLASERERERLAPARANRRRRARSSFLLSQFLRRVFYSGSGQCAAAGGERAAAKKREAAAEAAAALKGVSELLDDGIGAVIVREADAVEALTGRHDEVREVRGRSAELVHRAVRMQLPL